MDTVSMQNAIILAAAVGAPIWAWVLVTLVDLTISGIFWLEDKIK